MNEDGSLEGQLALIEECRGHEKHMAEEGKEQGTLKEQELGLNNAAELGVMLEAVRSSPELRLMHSEKVPQF